MTMNKLVTIRSNRYGLDIEFDSETEFDQLLEVLGQKFKQSGRFFKDAQMALSFSGRELTRAEKIHKLKFCVLSNQMIKMR